VPRPSGRGGGVPRPVSWTCRQHGYAAHLPAERHPSSLRFQNTYPGCGRSAHPARVTKDRRSHAALWPLPSLSTWITYIAKSFTHEGCNHLAESHEGACLGDPALPPRVAGGEEARVVRTMSTKITSVDSTRSGSRYQQPPGVSAKYNPIERRLFSHISMNWLGRPLTSLQTMLAYIRGTTTQTSLVVHSCSDDADYRTGERVSRRAMEELRIHPHDTLPDWNYTISPRSTI